jgi:Tol biopolymer transport system component
MRAVALIAAVLLVALAGGASADAGATSSGVYSVATSPSWSPDGKQIAFVVYPGLSQTRIVRTSAAPGGAVHTVHAGKDAGVGCCSPALWAAGGRILFVSNFSVRSVPLRGGHPKPLISPGTWFILSPTRKIAAVTHGCDCGRSPDTIAFVGVRGGSAVVVPRPDGATDDIDSFSPDGTQLVFSRSPFTADGPVYADSVLMAVPVDGGEPRPLAQSGIPGAALVPNEARGVQWSPNGRWVAFVEGLKLEVEPTAGGGSPRVLATHFGSDSFSWSPRSNLIAFDCCSNRANQRLMTVRPDGTHRSILTKGKAPAYAGSESGPQWSPDGSRLVFAARLRPPGDPIHIWTVRANGRDLLRRGN